VCSLSAPKHLPVGDGTPNCKLGAAFNLAKRTGCTMEMMAWDERVAGRFPRSIASCKAQSQPRPLIATTSLTTLTIRRGILIVTARRPQHRRRRNLSSKIAPSTGTIRELIVPPPFHEALRIPRTSGRAAISDVDGWESFATPEALSFSRLWRTPLREMPFTLMRRMDGHARCPKTGTQKVKMRCPMRLQARNWGAPPDNMSSIRAVEQLNSGSR
jgi:hypothetical protein